MLNDEYAKIQRDKFPFSAKGKYSVNKYWSTKFISKAQ